MDYLTLRLGGLTSDVLAGSVDTVASNFELWQHGVGWCLARCFSYRVVGRDLRWEVYQT
jgi:hypothetical protein